MSNTTITADEDQAAKEEERKRNRVYASLTAAIPMADPGINFSDGELNLHFHHLYLSMSLDKWRELNTRVEAAAAEAVSA